ncbi:unnamed protein product [Rhodiola kirilowii]
MGWKGILGFEYGIVQAPLGPDISGPELVAAVANAGGIGLLRAPDWEAPEYLRGLIRKTRTLTTKPFGVGVVLAFPHAENIRVILEEKVAVLQIGSVDDAKKVLDVGVDAVIVQGCEAGGHVIGQDGIFSLLPRVVDLVSGKIPVISAGGIGDGRGYVAALALGAQGICLGTRFVASEESYAHRDYKRKLIEFDKTEYTNIFGRSRWPGAPQRVLQSEFFINYKSLPAHENEANQPVIGHSIIHGQEKDIRRFAGTVPNVTTTGEIENMAMYAGESVGLIKEILPAGEVVKRLVEEAQNLLKHQFDKI